MPKVYECGSFIETVSEGRLGSIGRYNAYGDVVDDKPRSVRLRGSNGFYSLMGLFDLSLYDFWLLFLFCFVFGFRSFNQFFLSSTLRRSDSLSRARKSVRRICKSNFSRGGVSSWFVTATFAENQVDYDEALKAWSRFIRRLRSEFPDFSFIAVAEKQLRGAWHFHAVFFGLPDDSKMVKRFGWVNGMPDFYRVFRDEFWGEGRFEIKPTYGKPSRLTAYLVKYITKSIDVPSGRKCYWCGGSGLVRPSCSVVSYSDLIDFHEFLLPFWRLDYQFEFYCGESGRWFVYSFFSK